MKARNLNKEVSENYSGNSFLLLPPPNPKADLRSLGRQKFIQRPNNFEISLFSLNRTKLQENYSYRVILRKCLCSLTLKASMDH